MANQTTVQVMRMLPLLRSIAREVRERNVAIAELETRASSATDVGAKELQLVLSELALQRRELRRAETELRQLGWQLDPDHALQLVRSGRGGASELAWRPEDTGFFRAHAPRG